MQVTHQNEFVTHAVIGGKETIDFGISSSAEFFNILSSTLYKDQILAVVREVLCNAWDAHIEAGCTDRPVQITLDNGKFVIKDFGKGIHHEDMGPIYGTYGNSTKKNDGMQTGGFGLGCKAPFAYTDHFEVISCHDGVKTIYNLSKSSAQAQGKPGIITVASFPTNETGLTVSIRIKVGDRGRFLELIKRTVRNGDMNMLLNGEVLPKLDFDASKGNYLIVRGDQLLDSHNQILVRYGNVIYPIDTTSTLDPQYEAIVAHLDKLPGYTCIVFQAPPHSISVTPSRESLSMQGHTVLTLQKLFDDFLALLKGEFLAVCDAHAKKVVAEAVAEKHVGELLKKQARLPHTKVLENISKISDLASMAQAYMSCNYPDDLDYRKADITNRLNLMAQHNLLDRGKVQTFLLALKEVKTAVSLHSWRPSCEKSSWLQRRVVAPLLGKLTKAGLDTGKLFICDSDDQNYFSNNREKSPPLVPATKTKPKHLLDTLPYLRNIIVLTTRRHDLVNSAYENEAFTTLGKYQGFMVYTLGRKAAEIEAARKFFTGSGMVVVDLTGVEPAEKATRRVPTTTRKPAKKGLVCISGVTYKGNINTYLSNEENAERIEAPEFVIQLSIHKNSNHYALPQWSSVASRYLVELFGDKGGITKSSAIHESWIKRGAKSSEEYFSEKICSYVLFNPRIQTHWAFQPSRLKDVNDWGLLDIVCTEPLLMKEFGITNDLTEEDTKYLYLWEQLRQNSLGRGYQPHIQEEISRVSDWLATIPIDPALFSLFDKLNTNQLTSLIKVHQVKDHLRLGQESPLYQKTINFIISFINT